MKIIYYLILVLLFQSCKSFKEISTVKSNSEINGVYSNDCDSIDKKHRTKSQLWKLIDKDYKSEELGLLVKIEETKNKKILVQLINKDSIIDQKVIKGNFKIDHCYYKKRFFYIVPILPVLWWFENSQIRFYSTQNQLILEEKYDTGGVVIIMAGGNSFTTNWYYKKLK